MPNFFVPHAKNEEEAKSVRQSTIEFMKQQGFKIAPERKIFKIEYRHNGKNCVAEVGKIDSYGHEMVLILLDADSLYLCCTASRGVVRGEPILIGKDFYTSTSDFE